MGEIIKMAWRTSFAMPHLGEQKKNKILTLQSAGASMVTPQPESEMPQSPWKFVFSHRNPYHEDLRGQYRNEAEAKEYKGLLLVPSYDPHHDRILWGWWELRHKLSNESLLFIRADGEELAEQFATKVADLANWQHMRHPPEEWTAPPYSINLIEYLQSTNGVFHQPDFDALLGRPMGSTEADDELDKIVPFGRR